MPFALIFGAIGLAISAIGTFQSAAAANKQADASIKAEKLREKQMKLESERQRREVIRNAVAARSAAAVEAQVKGAQNSSAAFGSQGQITAQAANNTLGINQAESIGSGIFKANAAVAAAGGQVAWGQGLTSLGSAISGIRIG